MKSTTLLCFIMIVLLAACQSGQDPVAAVAALPPGDADSGEVLFNREVGGAPTCASCHLLTDQRQTGPGMAGYGERAGAAAEGESAEVYTYRSIVSPAAHIVAGYSNIMYTEYGRKLNDQQLADLIAYLLDQ